ncbi:MAG: hypothetical protein ABIT01_05325, partial [Thermoanaerobaculia bacterium]
MSISSFRRGSLRLVIALALCASGAAFGANFTVNTIGDNPDALINGTCADAGGKCSLRAAIMEGNAAAGPNTISFTITDGGAIKVIAVGTGSLGAVGLPMIRVATTIDATTQTG